MAIHPRAFRRSRNEMMLALAAGAVGGAMWFLRADVVFTKDGRAPESPACGFLRNEPANRLATPANVLTYSRLPGVTRHYASSERVAGGNGGISATAGHLSIVATAAHDSRDHRGRRDDRRLGRRTLHLVHRGIAHARDCAARAVARVRERAARDLAGRRLARASLAVRSCVRRAAQTSRHRSGDHIGPRP